MRKFCICLAGAAVIVGLFFLQANQENKIQISESTGRQEARRITGVLANPSLSTKDRLDNRNTLFALLSATGDVAHTHGPIAGPITNKTAKDLPHIGHIPGGPAASATAWAPGTDGFIPTNDWFQGIAGFPGKSGHMNSTGSYMLQWVGDKRGGLRFRVPVHFTVNGKSQPYILQTLDGGFTIGASDINNHPIVRWQETGNLVRNVSFDDGAFIIHAVQGGVFQGAHYNSRTPELTVPAGGKMTKTALSDPIVKYEISGKSRNYYVYGNASLNLTYDPATGALTSEKPYTGNLNIASLDAKSPSLMSDSQILDAHANAVVVKGQGTLLPDHQYQFSYLTQDLQGQESADRPLIFFKRHHVENLTDKRSPTGLAATTLTGKMEAYSGATFLFTARNPSKSSNPLDVLPTLDNGTAALTQAQARTIADDSSLTGVEYALSKAGDLQTGRAAYNKGIYQQGLTLAFAQRVLETAYPNGTIPKKHLAAMQRVYEKMKNNLRAIFSNLQYDTDYGTVVSATDDYGNHSYYNDHIAQYSYPLNALTAMKRYADHYAPTDTFFTAPIAGLPYSGQEMGDLLAADFGETGPGGHNPVNRNFDVYNSHSWLSGTQGYSDGSNTESQSEAVFGGLTVAAWLAATNPESPQAQVAKTRWAMESQGLQTYFLIDPQNSVYLDVSPQFVALKTEGSIPPVISNLFENKITSDTFWGSEWDRQLACEFMPAGANLIDSYLNNMSPNYRKLVADYILNHWHQYDMSNRIQSVLVCVVAKEYPDKAAELIRDVQQRNRMDDGTNAFLLRVIGEYAKNQQALQ